MLRQPTALPCSSPCLSRSLPTWVTTSECTVLNELSSQLCAVVFTIQGCFLFLWDLFSTSLFPEPLFAHFLFTHAVRIYFVTVKHSNTTLCSLLLLPKTLQSKSCTAVTAVPWCFGLSSEARSNVRYHKYQDFFISRTSVVLSFSKLSPVEYRGMMVKTPASFCFCHLPVRVHFIYAGYMSSLYICSLDSG